MTSAPAANDPLRMPAPHHAKLAQLKDRIRSSGCTVHDAYAGPAEFGNLVLADLGAVIERQFPEASRPDPLDRDRS